MSLFLYGIAGLALAITILIIADLAWTRWRRKRFERGLVHMLAVIDEHEAKKGRGVKA